MGDTQKLSPDEQIAFARNAYEDGTDFTVAVEEEFAILDPETLDLTNRFEELQAAAQGTPLEEHVVGELIASEVEVRTGRCETFGDAAALVGERRTQLRELAERSGVLLAGVGTHPWSPWQDQRIIDTPHYRVNTCVLAEWSPVSTPSWNGELADTASSSGSQFRSAVVTRTARSAPRIATCVCTPNVLLRQTTYLRISSFRR